MRLGIKYAAVLFGALLGLILGEMFGPAAGLGFDWDVMYPRWLSVYVHYHHYLFMGASASLFALIASRFFNSTMWPVLGFALLAGLLRFLADFVRNGESVTLDHVVWFGEFSIPYFIGMLAVFGFWFLINELFGPRFGKEYTL